MRSFLNASPRVFGASLDELWFDAGLVIGQSLRTKRDFSLAPTLTDDNQRLILHSNRSLKWKESNLKWQKETTVQPICSHRMKHDLESWDSNTGTLKAAPVPSSRVLAAPSLFLGIGNGRGIQTSPLTVTPSGHGKSVTVSKCHCNQRYFSNKPIIWDILKVSL